MDEIQPFDLCGQVIGAAMRVYNGLGSGFLESVYEKAFLWELEKSGIAVQPQVRIRVFYKGRIVGRFCADMLVESQVIVELKAVETLAKIHEVQLVNYLKATGIDLGLLINFGPRSLEYKRRVRILTAATIFQTPSSG